MEGHQVPRTLKGGYYNAGSFRDCTIVPGAVGFGPYSLDLLKRVTVVNLDGKSPEDEAYPCAVTLALIHRHETLTEAGAHLLEFFFTPKAQEIVRSLGGIPIKTRIPG
jgi:hypothetical protein